MIKIEFTQGAIQALNYERYHHPHPRVQRKMEALWLKSQGEPHNKIAQVTDISINYFEKNKERMQYAEYRRQGLFVGSGVLEADCRTIVGQRLKQSGMHWTVKGANSIIALRCCFLSNRWEDFWKYRACA